MRLLAAFVLFCAGLLFPATSGRAGLNEDIAYCESQVIPKFGGWSPGRAYTPPTPKSPAEFYCLGIAHWRGLFENKDLAKAAEMGHPRAQLQIGYQYEYGEGLPRSPSEAAKWYLKAATQGNAVAQMNLGNLYENGEGVPENWVEAAKWWRKSAEQKECEDRRARGWSGTC